MATLSHPQKPELAASRPQPSLNVCMVAYTFYETDNRVRRYAETLVRQGHRVDVFALQRAGQPKGDTFNGVRVQRLQRRIPDERSKWMILGKVLLFFINSMFALTREHIKRRYDLIHVHSLPDFEIFAALYPKLTGTKLILDIHDIVPEYYVSKFHISETSRTFKLLIWMERMSAAFSDHVIAANHIWGKRLEQRSVNRSKLTTLLNYPDSKIFRRRGRTRCDGKVILLYPGSLNYHQGLDIAIRAFSLINNDIPEAEFHIYGSGEQLPSLKALIIELALEGRVIHKGSLPLDQVAKVMEDADIGVVPKRKAGFGNEAFSTKTFEFMSMGVSVIVPDTDIDKLYFDDSVVRFFRAGDEKSLADAMLHLIKNSEFRESLAQNATKFVAQYLWLEHEAMYLGIIDSLMKTRLMAMQGSLSKS
jgi:glycosyltransferase involved in cell wall biosynthesis